MNIVFLITLNLLIFNISIIKKVLLTLCAVGLMSFSCPENSSAISSSCFSGCVSVIIPLTGFLELDARNAGPQKPTAAEFAEAQQLLDDYCDSL